MSWELDAEHRDFQEVCRTFVDRHVRPAVGEAEALGCVPQQLWKELGAAGLLGLLTPEEYGGSGATSWPWPCWPKNWPGPAGASR